MAYSPQTWSDGNASYPVSAARMGNIETGLQAAALVADQGVQILTTTAKNALTGVTTGWMVYDSTLAVFQFWNGSAWQTFAGDTGWIAISSYSNSWASNSGPASGGSAAGYRRFGNRVILSGQIKSGASGNAAFTLPSGYRPTVAMAFPGATTGGGYLFCYWLVATTGVVTPTFSAGNTPSLDGITFMVD